MFCMVVQDSRRTPSSGKVVAQLGHYDPHAKNISIDKEKAAVYLNNGAQPSDRVARLLQAEGVKLPSWVKVSAAKQRTVRNAEKRRSTRPAEEVEETPAEEPIAAAEGAPAENVVADTPAETEAKTPAEEKAA